MHAKIYKADDIREEWIPELEDFVRNGGGLIVAGCGAIHNLAFTEPLSELPVNCLLGKFGIVLTSDFARKHVDEGFLLEAIHVRPPLPRGLSPLRVDSRFRPPNVDHHHRLFDATLLPGCRCSGEGAR